MLEHALAIPTTFHILSKLGGQTSGESMNTQRVLALLLMLSLRVVAQQGGARTTQTPDVLSKPHVQLIVSHPDDEAEVSAYLAQLLDQGKRVAAVYLTRGEAGHNE